MALRFYSEIPTDVTRQGMVYVLFMVQSGWRWREARLSINQRDSSDIHRIIGARAHGGGGISNAFRSWNLVSTRFSGPVKGRVKGKAWCPLSYPPWQWVGCFSIHARNVKWTDAKFLGSLIPTVSNLAVQPKDVVASHMKNFYLLDLPPHIYVEEVQPLTEMTDKADQAKGARKSSTCCICGFWRRNMSVFKSPMMMGYIPRNRFSASSRSRRQSRVEGGRYTPMIEFFCPRNLFHSSPRLVRGSALIRHYILLAAPSQPGPPPLALHRHPCPKPGSTQPFTPGGCGITPCPEYSSPSAAWGHSYQNALPGWPGGGRSHIRTGYCTFRGWSLGGGAACAAVAAAPRRFGCYHYRGGYWIR